MKKMIEKALYSCENEITVRNLEQEQANGDNTMQDKCHIQRVSNNEVMVCDCKKEWSEWEWKHNKCRKCGGIIEY